MHRNFILFLLVGCGWGIANPAPDLCRSEVRGESSPWTSVILEPIDPIADIALYDLIGRARVVYKGKVSISRIRIFRDNEVDFPNSVSFAKDQFRDELASIIIDCLNAEKAAGRSVREPVVCQHPAISRPRGPTPRVTHANSFSVGEKTRQDTDLKFFSRITFDNFLEVSYLGTAGAGRDYALVFPTESSIINQVAIDQTLIASVKAAIKAGPEFPPGISAKKIPAVAKIVFRPPPAGYEKDNLRGIFEVTLNNGFRLTQITLESDGENLRWIIYPSTLAENLRLAHLLLPNQALRATIEPELLKFFDKIVSEGRQNKWVVANYPVSPLIPVITDIEFKRPFVSFTINGSLQVKRATLDSSGSIEYPFRNWNPGNKSAVIYFEGDPKIGSEILSSLRKATDLPLLP